MGSRGPLLRFPEEGGELCAHQSFKLLRRCTHRGSNRCLCWKSKPKQPSTLQYPSQTVESFRPASGASEAASGRSSGGYCRGGQTGKGFTLNHSHLKKEGRLPKSASHSFSAAPREVCLERCNVVVIAGVLGAAGTGQLELLGSVG